MSDNLTREEKERFANRSQFFTFTNGKLMRKFVANEIPKECISENRFITWVTWEILNIQVFQEVITNLDTDTLKTTLNGQLIPIFGKEWQHKMRAVFYINIFLAKREPSTPRVHAADLLPNIKEKMRSKLGTCKINDCTILEARKPLKFFKSLFFSHNKCKHISMFSNCTHLRCS